MTTAIILVFIVGYILIALETVTLISKTAVALLMAVVCWMLYYMGFGASAENVSVFTQTLGETSEILFFLLGAMVIVEVVDTNGGFDFVREKLHSKTKRSLLWKLTFMTFSLSAVLDNMTTAIVMIMVLNKLIGDDRDPFPDQKSKTYVVTASSERFRDKLLYSSMVILAANSGGAFSPIGDVTTIMLWVKGNISTIGVIKSLFIPSLVSIVVPGLIVGRFLKGQVVYPGYAAAGEDSAKVSCCTAEGSLSVEGTSCTAEGMQVYNSGGYFAHGYCGGNSLCCKTNLKTSAVEKWTVFAVGVGGLLFVPVFRFLTGLPPFMGILLVLSILWVVTEFIFRQNKYKDIPQHCLPDVSALLHKIDISTILFFLGILTAVSALSETGALKQLGDLLDVTFDGNPYIVTTIIGFFSAVVDNVPLVASCMGMYDLSTYAMDNSFWFLLAYCAGIGGSMLIIGSAAGVVVMGLQRISFGWYLRHFSWIACLGYLAGILAFWLQELL